jgi:hypothetical protein
MKTIFKALLVSAVIMAAACEDIKDAITIGCSKTEIKSGLLNCVSESALTCDTTLGLFKYRNQYGSPDIHFHWSHKKCPLDGSAPASTDSNEHGLRNLQEDYCGFDSSLCGHTRYNTWGGNQIPCPETQLGDDSSFTVPNIYVSDPDYYCCCLYDLN